MDSCYEFANEPIVFTWSAYFGLACALVMAIICMFGIFGNLLSIKIFLLPSFRTLSINILLSALGFADTILLILAFPVFCLAPVAAGFLSSGNPIYVFFVFSTVYLYPIAMMCRTASIWLLMLITMERWVAVCRPLLASIYCTRKRAIVGSLLVYFLSFAFNVIRFWEYGHCPNGEIYLKLRDNAPYLLWYENVAGLCTRCLIPLTVLITFNSLIAHGVVRARKRRRKLTVVSSSAEQNDNNTTKMLVYVVLVFIICLVFGFVLNLAEIFEFDFTTEWGYALSDFNNVLNLFNSACTCFFYLKFSTRYRQAAKQVLFTDCCCLRFCFVPPDDISNERTINTSETRHLIDSNIIRSRSTCSRSTSDPINVHPGKHIPVRLFSMSLPVDQPIGDKKPTAL